ncbi:MAG: hypothetical protein Q4F31_01460 [Eubacteriales bacterium]|nr:hypothetical protein [Eubacteriales bacterium]
MVFFDGSVDGWQFFCSEYDFLIPDKVRRVSADMEPSFDPVLSGSNEIIVYTDDREKDIESCIDYIEKSGNKTLNTYERISTSYSMNVYKVLLRN